MGHSEPLYVLTLVLAALSVQTLNLHQLQFQARWLAIIYGIVRAIISSTKMMSHIIYYVLKAQLSLSSICYMQDEERFRNNVMLDLLYVHPAHPLASHIIHYYRICSHLPPPERFVGVIDANARLVDLIINQLSCLQNYDHFPSCTCTGFSTFIFC